MINLVFDSPISIRCLSKTRWAHNLSLFFFSFCIAAPGFAQVAGRQSSSSSGLAGAWFGLVTLSLLVALVAVVLWLFKKGKFVGATGSGVDLLAMQPLGPREQLVVVKINGRILVLGHTAHQISFITELNEFKAPPSRPNPMPQGLQAQINSFLTKGRTK
jgi:flagellar protein FliO/FliZ